MYYSTTSVKHPEFFQLAPFNLGKNLMRIYVCIYIAGALMSDLLVLFPLVCFNDFIYMTTLAAMGNETCAPDFISSCCTKSNDIGNPLCY